MALGTSIDREDKNGISPKKIDCVAGNGIISENGVQNNHFDNEVVIQHSHLDHLNAQTSSIVVNEYDLDSARFHYSISDERDYENENGHVQNGELESSGDDSEEDTNAEKGELEANGTATEKKNDSSVDFVFIQDIGLMVKIQCRGTEVDLQVSSMELMQEIHQLLMDREDTCHRTCFSLQFDGNTLDNFAELKSIEGLKEGSVIKNFTI